MLANASCWMNLLASIVGGSCYTKFMTAAYGAPSSPASYIDVYCCALQLMLTVDLQLICLHCCFDGCCFYTTLAFGADLVYGLTVVAGFKLNASSLWLLLLFILSAFRLC
ncbi:unnamed protein product [Amaranthus hypochondriacus]